MIFEVRHVVLTLKRPHMGLDEINRLLQIALYYNQCSVSVALDGDQTRFMLYFKKGRTDLYVREWVKFWMRPFDLEYELRFMKPGEKADAKAVTAH